MALFGNGASNERGNLTMKHAVILCKSETNPTSTVYFDPKVDYIGSINNCTITIPNLSNRNMKDIAVTINGKDNMIDLQIPQYDPNENHCTKFRVALRVYPSNSMDTFMDTCIDFAIGFNQGMNLASLGDYKYTKKGFGDDGIACNSRNTLVNIIQDLFHCNQMWRDLTSIKCGDYYVESRKDNWITGAGLKAKLIIYRKTK